MRIKNEILHSNVHGFISTSDMSGNQTKNDNNKKYFGFNFFRKKMLVNCNLLQTGTLSSCAL